MSDFFKNFVKSSLIVGISAACCSTAVAKSYKAAEIYTADTTLYGKYVFRMKAAQGSGILSNFFLWKEYSEMSDVFWEEVDIEVLGKNNAKTMQSNIITGLNSRTTSEQYHDLDAGYADGYHTYSVEWTPEYIAWLIDGEVVRKTTGGQVPDIQNPTTSRFNFWAANIPEWVGDFDDSILPVNMFVNWVEYYDWDGDSFNLEWRDDFDYFDNSRWIKAEHTFDENLTDFVPENALTKDGYLVLAMTREGSEGFSGDVPVDAEPNPGATATPQPQVTATPQPVVTATPQPVVTATPQPVVTATPAPVDGGVVCDYQVKNEWNTGFTAEIVLTNTGTESVSDWDVSWSYLTDQAVQHSWNAVVSGEGTYSASSLTWNNIIYPGQSVSFGFVGQKAQSDVAETPVVSGDVCQ